MTATVRTNAVPAGAIYVLSTAHFLHDAFVGIWFLVLTAQRSWLELSYTQAAIGSVGFVFASSITQPAIGGYFDRTGRSIHAIWGVAWCAISVALAAIAPNFAIMLAAAISAGLGAAAFHAAGLNNARLVAAGRGQGRTTAIFLLGGNIGLGAGAYVGGAVLDKFGGNGLILPAVVVSLLTPAFIWSLRPYLKELSGLPGSPEQERSEIRAVMLVPVVAFVFITMMRELSRGGFATFLPQYLEAQGSNLQYAGSLAAVLLIFGAVGSYVGGELTDWMPRRRLAVVTLLASIPLSFWVLESSGFELFLATALFGLTVSTSLPILLLIGEEVLPGGKNAAGSYAFGITFFLGGVANLIIGPAADVVGLDKALMVAGVLPLVAVVFFLFLPSKTDRQWVGEAA